MFLKKRIQETKPWKSEVSKKGKKNKKTVSITCGHLRFLDCLKFLNFLTVSYFSKNIKNSDFEKITNLFGDRWDFVKKKWSTFKQHSSPQMIITNIYQIYQIYNIYQKTSISARKRKHQIQKRKLRILNCSSWNIQRFNIFLFCMSCTTISRCFHKIY